MALNRIERWTRQVLEQEARKRGIRDPEVRSHAELAGMILRHDYASPQSLRNARKLLGTLLESAGVTLPTGRRADVPPPPVAYARTADEHAPRAQQQPTPEAQRPAPVQPPVPAVATTQPDASADTASPGGSGIDSVRLDSSRPAPRELHVRWQVSEQAAARARSLLGSDGELAVRLVSVRADPAHVVRSEVTEHGPITHEGEWVAELASEDTHCVAAIGVRNAGRFVSIVHRSSRPTRSTVA
jgi:hypothetical protein